MITSSKILRLDDYLLLYNTTKDSSGYYDTVLDTKKTNPSSTITIPYDGLVLDPGVVYVGRTAESVSVGSDSCIQMDGLLELSKLGLFVSATGGYGGTGFSGKFPLTLHCIQPVRIYPYMNICRVYFTTTTCEWSKWYSTGCPEGTHMKLK